MERSSFVCESTIVLDNLVQHVVGVRFGKIPAKLALDIIGMLVKMMKHRAVEDEGFQRARPLPEDLQKRPPEIPPERLRAETEIIEFLHQHCREFQPIPPQRADRRLGP